MLDRLDTPADARTDATLAPKWHTAALVALIVGVASIGTLLAHANLPAPAQAAQPSSRIASQYLPVLAMNWGLFLYCTRLFRAQSALPALLGERWHGTRRALVDLAAACACCVLILGVELAWSRLFPMRHNAAAVSLLPSTEAERLTWIAVALSVGFCEEIVYRGYLQTQLGAFARSAWLGVVLQAVLFGVAHLDQGLPAALRIAGYGLMFGLLVRARRSLIPSIACHVAIDLAAGFLR